MIKVQITRYILDYKQN